MSRKINEHIADYHRCKAAVAAARRLEQAACKMLYVLAEMANGAVLKNSRWLNLKGSYWLEWPGIGKRHETIARPIIAGLEELKTIQDAGRESVWRHVYELTDHGRRLVEKGRTK